MKLRDEGFQYGVLDLHPETATNGVTPFAIVGSSGAVAIQQLSNGMEHAALYRTEMGAKRALGKVETPGFKLWSRPS